MAQSHTGHLTGSDAVTSAVFRQFGVTRVDGLDELLEVSAAFARTVGRRRGPSGRAPACASTRSPAAPARTWPTCSPPPGCALPDLTKRRRRRCTTAASRYLRVSNPVDCGGPPVGRLARAARSSTRSSPTRTSTSSIVPDHRRAGRRCREPFTARPRRRRRDHRQADLRGVGRAAGTDDTYYSDVLLDGGLPVFRTFGNCVQAVKAYVDYWSSRRATARRSPSRSLAARRRPKAAARARWPRPARALVRARVEAAARGVRHQASRDDARARRPPAAVEAAADDRLPGRDEGRRRPTSLTRATSGSCEVGVDDAERGARAATTS